MYEIVFYIVLAALVMVLSVNPIRKIIVEMKPCRYDPKPECNGEHALMPWAYADMVMIINDLLEREKRKPDPERTRIITMIVDRLYLLEQAKEAEK